MARATCSGEAFSRATAKEAQGSTETATRVTEAVTATTLAAEATTTAVLATETTATQVRETPTGSQTTRPELVEGPQWSVLLVGSPVTSLLTVHRRRTNKPQPRHRHLEDRTGSQQQRRGDASTT